MVDAVLAGIVGVPLLLLMLLRINASLVFLSVCLGDILVKFVGADAVSAAGTFSAHPSAAVKAGTSIAVLLAPVFLTMLFMVGTVRRNKMVFNFIMSAAVGLLLLLIIVPMLTPGTARSITASPLWPQLLRAQDLIVGVGCLLALFFLLGHRPKSPDEHKKHH